MLLAVQFMLTGMKKAGLQMPSGVEGQGPQQKRRTSWLLLQLLNTRSLVPKKFGKPFSSTSPQKSSKGRLQEAGVWSFGGAEATPQRQTVPSKVRHHPSCWTVVGARLGWGYLYRRVHFSTGWDKQRRVWQTEGWSVLDRKWHPYSVTFFSAQSTTFYERTWSK